MRRRAPSGLICICCARAAIADLDTIPASLSELKAGALMIGFDGFLIGRLEKLGAMTLRQGVPGISHSRIFAAAGGLMSYGAPEGDEYRLAGLYAGSILKGEKPADLPVQQPTTFELVINLKTAKALGLTIPETLLATADQVIQ
jgi:putative ABC transport system substrate-binding protein